jgi:hypothetical protein
VSTTEQPRADHPPSFAPNRRTGVAGFLRHEAGVQWAEIEVEYVRPVGAKQPGLVCVSTRSSDGRAWHGCTLTVAEGEQVLGALRTALAEARGEDAPDDVRAS